MVVHYPGRCRNIPSGGGLVQAYCVKCRTQREVKDAQTVSLKNGTPATQGVCPTCGTKIFRIGKA